MNFSVTIIGALIGAVVLLFGRKLFWLCVAAIGFAAGVELAPHLVHEPSALLSLTIALLLGIIGALLAVFLQKIAIGVLGFLAGGKLAGATRDLERDAAFAQRPRLEAAVGEGYRALAARYQTKR